MIGTVIAALALTLFLGVIIKTYVDQQRGRR